MKKKQYRILLLGTILAGSLQAMDNAHWFRAPLFFGEPRLAEPRLASFDISIAGGSTDKGRNAGGYTVPLLNIYGAQNMHLLGSNIPGKDLSTIEDVTLVMLERIASRDGFGYLNYFGRFHIVEAMIAWTQNFDLGAFMQVFLPVRGVELSNIRWCDCSPTDCICPNATDPNWQRFLTLYEQILKRYEISAGNYKKHGFGDLSILFGWSCNYEDIRTIDYIDFGIRFGLILPTGKKNYLNQAFDMPLGYNGHVGIPVVVDASFGAYDWFTLGLHAGVLPFINKKYCVRVKTDPRQCGFIKLAMTNAKVQLGTIWDVGAFIKADHVGKGLSFLFGYSHQRQQRTILNPCDPGMFNIDTVNNDPMLLGWSMHTLHFMADYDFSKEEHRIGGRVGVFYNRQITGKNVFQTHTGGGSFGIDFAFIY